MAALSSSPLRKASYAAILEKIIRNNRRSLRFIPDESVPSDRPPRTNHSRASSGPVEAQGRRVGAEQAGREGAESRRDSRHRGRAAAGDVSGGAQPDDRRHRDADHRPPVRRFREPVLDRPRLSAHLDGGRAALRQAQRHVWPPRHDARRHRYFRTRLGGVRARPQHGGAGARARPAGTRRRRHSPGGAIDSRRHHRAARTRTLAGLWAPCG